MSEEKQEKSDPVAEFRKRLHGLKAKELEKVLVDGLGHAKAEIRALAAKTGIRHFDRKWVKSHITKLIDSEKSKKVLRVLESSQGGQKLKKAFEKVQANLKKNSKKDAAAKTESAPEKADEAQKS